jgi:hypothetical protein
MIEEDITSEVMVPRRRRPIVVGEGDRAVKKRLPTLVLVLLVFTVYSVYVVVTHGYFGFLTVAWREPWAMQMLLDLTIALTLFTRWMIPDARRRGISWWPYLAACVALGSIGALAYLVRRAFSAESVAAAS